MEIKSIAAREGRTLAEVIERTLRRGVEHARPARRPRVKLPSYDLGPFLADPADRAAWSGGRSAPVES